LKSSINDKGIAYRLQNPLEAIGRAFTPDCKTVGGNAVMMSLFFVERK